MSDPFGVFKISYLVIHPTPESDGASPFQGFGWGVIETTSAFARIALLPPDVRELRLNQDLKTAHRIVDRGCQIFPLQLDALEPALRELDVPFLVICSHPGVTDAVERILRETKQKRPIWHVRPASMVGDNRTLYPDLTVAKSRAFIQKVASHLQRSREMPRAGALIQEVLNKKRSAALRALIQRVAIFLRIPWGTLSLPIAKYSHGLTAPTRGLGGSSPVVLLPSCARLVKHYP